MDRFYQSSSATSSRLSPPHTAPPPRPSLGSEEGAEMIESLQRYIASLNKRIDELKALLKEKDGEIQEFNTKRAVQVKELHELRNDREAQRLYMESTKARVTELKAQLSKSEGEVLKARDLKSKLSAEFSSLKRQLEGTEHRLKEAEERADSMTGDLKSMETSRDAACEEARKTRDELNDCRSKLQAQTEECARLQKLNDKLSENLTSLKKRYSENIKMLDDQVEEFKKQKRAAERQRDEALEKAATLEQQHMAVENELHKLKLELKDFEKSDGRLRLTIDELKAKIRGLEEERGALQNDRNSAEKVRAESVAKYERLEHSQESILAENRRLREEIDDLKRLDKQKIALIDDLNAKIAKFADEKHSSEATIAQLRKANDDVKAGLKMCDEQFEHATEKLKITTQSKEKLAEELVSVKEELETSLKDYEGLRKAMQSSEAGLAADNRRLREKLESVTEDNRRFKEKVESLESLSQDNRLLREKLESLESLNEDYKEELDRLEQEKDQLETRNYEQLQRFSAENKENEQKVAQDLNMVKHLEQRLRDLERSNAELKDAEFRAMRECEALKKRVVSAEEEKLQMAHNEAEARLELTKTRSEMEKLRNSFTDSTASALQLPTVQEDEVEEEESDCEDQYQDAQDQYQHQEPYDDRMATPTRIPAYERYASSVEKKRDYIGVPLLRGDRLSSSTSQIEELQHPPTKTISTGRTCKSKSSSTLGTMRHDIPHRFKSSIGWKHGMCGVCFEAIPSFRYLYKCQECGMTTHRRCCSEAIHTCGLPSGCADFYIENSMLASPSPTLSDANSVVMNGWVKMAFNGNGPWRDYWATMTRDKLAFYDNEALAVNDGTPRFAIYMNDDTWRIHSGTSTSLHSRSKALAIEIHMTTGQLYLLAPTIQSKQRWVQSLQKATNRRLYVRRKSSKLTVPVRNTPFLTMNHPENLSVNATLLCEGFLLIASQEGLYTVPVDRAQSSALVRIAGLLDVYHMELIEELNRLLIVHGYSRELLLVNLGQLRATGKSSVCAESTRVGNISNCHLMVTNKNPQCRLVYAATTDKIYVLRTNRDASFTVVREIPTEEPCTCLLPTARGFVFGADDFHIVTIDNKRITKQAVRINGCPPDYPVCALNISENEVLLAYHNYGVFVDLDGRRTRKDNVDWSRAPLEFVYTEPYLYVVHYESLEILEVAPYSRGTDSKTFRSGESDMYKCRNAHFSGMGPRPNDVIFALAASDRVELHMFNLGRPIDCLKV